MKHRAPDEGGGTGGQGTGTSTNSGTGSTESGAANGGTGTGTPAGTGASGTEGQGGGQGTGSDGVQSPFQHEVLKKYKTPTEVEAYVRTLEATVMEQGSQLNAASRAAAPPAAGSNGSTSGAQTAFTNDDFYKEPIKVISGMLEEAIKPFRQDLVQGRAKTAREELREKYSDFAALEPAVDTLLRAQGILESATKESLQFVYFAVKGQMAANGTAAPTSTTEQPRTDPVNQQNNGQNGGNGGTWFPPQHRPSGSPLPDGGGGGGAPKLRDLTENEERVRREMGKSKEDFLALMDASPTDVATMKLPSEATK